jgi:alpha-D-ribose 1-methylphosphonate 5-triphosphate synthase subunit PhnG
MIHRTQWISALKEVPADVLVSVTNKLSEDWEIRPKSLTQSGLGIMKLKDSAFHETFYLGEFPLASAWLQITTPEGNKVEGAAQVMDDRVDIAEAMAICDAVLSAKLPGWENVSDLVNEGAALRKQKERERKAILARTRVDFSLLDNVGGEDAGN